MYLDLSSTIFLISLESSIILSSGYSNSYFFATASPVLPLSGFSGSPVNYLSVTEYVGGTAASNLGKNVYHTFTWRGFFDFGAGAFGDMACHTMNLAFRGLELGGVSDAECTKIISENDVAYPLKSIVKLTYRERDSKVRPGVKLPAVTLYWYDGDEKPAAELMPKWAAKNGGKVPNTGCLIMGSKGQVLMQDDYGAKCAIALDADKEFKDVFQHEAAKAVARCRASSAVPARPYLANQAS